MFLYLVLFTLLSVAVAFGATYLLLRRTAYAPYSILLSLVSFQPFLILCITTLGYRMPVPLRAGTIYFALLVGMSLTGFVVVRYREELWKTFRATWNASVLIYGLAMTSMVLATPILIGSLSLAYIDWWNGELVNYAYFAHSFLGKFRDPNYIPFFEANALLRYGAELFLAVLSALTAKAPMLLVEVLAAFHKASAIIAFAVGCDLLRKEREMLTWAVVAADVGFAFATILSLNHILPFLAAQAVTPSFIFLGLGVLTGGIKARGVQFFLAIHVLFVLITYSEALPFLCALATLVFIEALYSRRNNVAIGICVVFGAGLLVNPILALHRFGFLYRLRSAVTGYNVLGNPKDNLLAYVGAALGFQYPFLDVPPLPRTLLLVGVCLALGAIIAAFGIAALRLRTLLFLAIPLLLLLMHFDLTASVQPVTSAYYKSYKMIAALYFYIFAALGFLVDRLLRRGLWKGIARIGQALLFAGVVAFLASSDARYVTGQTLLIDGGRWMI